MILMTVFVVQCFTTRTHKIWLVIVLVFFLLITIIKTASKYSIMFSKTIRNVLAIFLLPARLRFGKMNIR